MKGVIHRTRPRLFILGMTLLGTVFFALLFLLTYRSFRAEHHPVTIVALVFFGCFSLGFFYFLVNTKVVILTREEFIISHLFLPIKRVFELNDVRRLELREKAVNAAYGSSITPSYIFTEAATLVTLSDNSEIELISLSPGDFQELNKAFSRLKRGEGLVKAQQRSIVLYLLENADGIFWIILLLALCLGLGYNLLAE